MLFDTNVLFSAFVRNSNRLAMLIEWVTVNHEAVITEYIASELLRNASLKAPDSVNAVASFLVSPELHYVASDPDSPRVYPRIQDSKDQPILNAAIDNDVDIIITGDKHFHALEIDRPRIMFASEFVTEFLPELS